MDFQYFSRRTVPFAITGAVIRPSDAGFSMIETLVTLTIMMILAATAIPGYMEMNAASQRGNRLHEVEFDLRRARNEAIARGSRVVFQTSADGKSYTLGFDDLPYNSPASEDETLIARTLGEIVSISANTTLIFDSRGFLVNESGVLTTGALELRSNADIFSTCSISPTGVVSFTGY